MKPLTIGYPTTCYGTRRVSHALPISEHGVRYRSVRRVPLHRVPWAPAHWTYICRFLRTPPVDAVHLWNRICVNKVPWVASFEMEFPRYSSKVGRQALDHAFRHIASDHCRLLLPLSEAAKHHFLARLPNEYRADIESKVHVFTGGVAIPEEVLRLREQHSRDSGQPFRVGFVGRNFFRKGGPALFTAAQILRERGYDLRLLIISDLAQTTTYAADVPEALSRNMPQQLQAASWVELHCHLPNNLVLRSLAQCDAFAFPTLDESLGWGVLEAQGIGLPIIATNIFAIPELVQPGVDACLIELPLDTDRRWTGIPALNQSPRPDYEETMQLLVHGIARALNRLIDNPALCAQMGAAGQARFRAQYAESTAALKLANLLRAAI